MRHSATERVVQEDVELHIQVGGGGGGGGGGGEGV